MEGIIPYIGICPGGMIDDAGATFPPKFNELGGLQVGLATYGDWLVDAGGKSWAGLERDREASIACTFLG